VKKYFLALTPQNELNEKISSDKKRIFEEIGDQQYLMDPPHITLYVGQTSNMDKVIFALDKFMHSNKNKVSLRINIEGWKLFSDDIVTRKDAIALGFDKETVVNLRQFQTEVINYLIEKKAIYVTEDEIHHRYSDSEKFKAEQRKLLAEKGYPFIGKEWIPHINICCTQKENIDIIKGIINIEQYFSLRSKLSLKMFELIDDVPHEIWRYDLG